MLRYLTPSSFRIKNSSCWIRLIGESLKNYQQHPLQFIYSHSKYRQRLNNNEMSSVKNENVPAKNEMKKLGKEARKKQTEGDDGDGPEKPSKYVLKPPKGMRDFGQQQMLIRHKVFKIITDAFKRNGALALDTPVVESKQLLTGKYGEDSKLIYDLEEQEGEILSLRYDLTVPFARHLAQNKITKITRYSINAVYRRDNPSITKGRFREFYQCDFDIAGKFDPIVPDSKCLKVLCEILTDLDLKSFIIKVNHRLLLNGMFSVAGVPEEKFKTICSSIDKLGKLTWEEIKQEMCRDKGLDESVADRIGELIKYHGSIEMLNELLSSDLGKNSNAKKGLEDLKILHDLCKKFDIEKNIEFDLSLARGLDYYTGVIYEAVLQDDGLEVGSIAAGGRYDGLVGLLSADKHDVPCVGVSVGIERVLAIIEKRLSLEPSIEVECFVISIGKGMVEERLKIIRELDDAQIAADQLDKGNPKLLPQIQAAEEKNIPFAIMLGENELKDGIVKIRDIKSRAETPIERTKLVEELKKMLKERRSELVEDGNRACSEPEKIIGTSDEISKKMGGDAVEDEKSNQLLGLYTPKGMQDYDPERMLDREQVFDTIVNTFKRAGAQPLDTPVCELKETLLGKYGPEEEKAIFHIADQGGEILSLRYDLTVPFARYLTMFKLSSMKRFHIGKVYRIDNPDKTKGVLREFYQCDFDIAGQSDAMIADSRCLRVLYKSLKDVGIQSFIIKVNMRPILDGVFTLAGATQDKFKTLFTAVDKARKTSWDKIKGDLIKETGLTEAIVDKIGELIKHRGSQEKLDELLNSELGAIKSVQEALESLKILFKYCQALGIEDDAIEFNLSLARGLDYYTGIIFEASLKDLAHSEFGSIAGGGRYDGLVTLLAGSKHKVPAVGFSIGGDRLLAIRELQKTVKVK